MWHKFFSMICCVAVVLFMSTTVAADVVISGPITLKWQAPTTNASGAPLTDLAGYKIYHSFISGQYTAPPIEVDDQTALSWSFSLPLNETTDIFFVMTAVNTSGAESVFSNEVKKTVTITVTDDSPPAAPVLESVDLYLTCTVESEYITCTVDVK